MAKEVGGQVYRDKRGQISMFAGEQGDKFIEVEGDKS